MAKYVMDDGRVVDTDNATRSWDEDRYFDGHNRISRATGSQWEHEKLFQSRKGNYYIRSWSQYQGAPSHARWVSVEEAAQWMVRQDVDEDDMPSDVRQIVADATE